MRRQTAAVMMLVWILVGIGCATYLPGNPDHDWLHGRWFTHRTSGWTTELNLRVVDGNIVVGTNIQTAPDGRRGTGDVRGGVEGERINFEVYFPHSGNTYTYTLFRKSNVLLEGKSTTGNVILHKAS